MKNITLALDDETYRRARIRAAEQDTSVSALVKEFLLKVDETRGERSDAGSGARAALLARLRSEPVMEVGRWSRDELYEDVLQGGK